MLVALIGGDHNTNTTSAEFYDSVSGTFTAGGTMSVYRSHPTVTLLPNERQVLLTGGINLSYQILQTAELLDLKSGKFSPTKGLMADARTNHEAALLDDGKVLLTGGARGPTGKVQQDAELYDSVTGTFRPTGPMMLPRWGHQMTVLPDGRVLVTGGESAFGGLIPILAELYDPATETFSPAGDMNHLRFMHQAIRLRDGRVLILGGINLIDGTLTTHEIYDPASGTFATVPVEFEAGSAVVLEDGRVLILGRHPFVYSPSTHAIVPVTGFVTAPRGVLLDDGTVLHAANVDFSGNDPTAYSFDPRTNHIAPLVAKTARPRQGNGLVAIPRQRSRQWVRLNPLLVLLGSKIFLDLQLPDPPPPGVLAARVRAALAGLHPEERREFESRLRELGASVAEMQRAVESVESEQPARPGRGI